MLKKHDTRDTTVVTTADGRVIKAAARGEILLPAVTTKGHDKNENVRLEQVHYMPGLTSTLVSVAMLTDAGYKVEFDRDGCVARPTSGNEPPLYGKREGGVYRVLIGNDDDDQASGQAALALATDRSLENWHRRLGHASYSAIRRMAKLGVVTGLEIDDVHDQPIRCTICALCKAIYKSSVQRSERDDRVVHMDLSGPIDRSIDGKVFMMAANCRGFISVYGLKGKDEATEAAEAFLNFIKRQAPSEAVNLKIIRTDGGTEFVNGDMTKIVRREGIHHQQTDPYSSHENGVAERTIRTVVEMASAMILDSFLPHFLWTYALTHAAFLRNRIPRSGETITPFEKIYGRKPDVRELPVFGQSTVVRMNEPRPKGERFYGRGLLGAFIGWNDVQRSATIYFPNGDPRIMHSANVYFLDTMLKEEVEIDSPTNSDDERDADFEPEADADSDYEAPASTRTDAAGPEATDPGGGVRRSERIRRQREREPEDEDPVSRAQRVQRDRLERHGMGHALAVLQAVLKEPLNLREAMRCPDWEKWKKAIHTEIDALEANDTFELVDPPDKAAVLDNTVQFRIKMDVNGEAVYKARVCARGDRQVYGIHFVDTYAQVAKLDTIRVFLALVVKFEMHTLQGDVPSAYVKAKLTDVIYMKQVPGFEKQPGKVYRLKKALYGLKQAGREWHSEIDAFLKSMGLKSTKADDCLYYRRSANGLLLVCLYVDDIVVAHPDQIECERVMDELHKKYAIKVMGEAKQFLGMLIERPAPDKLEISQESYIDEVLYRFEMADAKPSGVPMIANTRLDLTEEISEDERREMLTVPYRQAVGALQYLQRVSRPDVAFAVQQEARHCANPRRTAWSAMKTTLRYLISTKSSRVCFEASGDELRVVSDADHANDKTDRLSVSGVVIFLFGCPVSWRCKKQSVVAKSTTVAELIAADYAVDTVDVIRLIVEEILNREVKTVESRSQDRIGNGLPTGNCENQERQRVRAATSSGYSTQECEASLEGEQDRDQVRPDQRAACRHVNQGPAEDSAGFEAQVVQVEVKTSLATACGEMLVSSLRLVCSSSCELGNQLIQRGMACQVDRKEVKCMCAYLKKVEPSGEGCF